MSGQSGATDAPLRPWQDSLHTAGEALDFLLSSGTHSDVTLVVGPECKQFKVHRLILSMRSPVFEDLLLLNPATKGNLLPLKDDPPWAFHWLLSHIYSDKREIDNIDLALQILSLADKYMIASAYDTSIRYLQTVVKRNNVLKIYKYLVHLFSDNDSLRGLCKRVFMDNGNAVLMSPDLLDLTPEALTQLFKETLRITSETVIFQALVKWGQAQLKVQRKPLTASGLRQEVSQFLPLIRFLTMSSDEVVQSVVTSDVLMPEEVVFVLKHLAKPEDGSHSSIVGNSFRINPSRESRASRVTKEQMRTCVCEGVNKTWLREPTYEFHLTPSDNIVLLAIKVQVEGGSEDVQVQIRKEEGSKVLATAEAQGNSISFKNPVHLRESVNYVFTLQLSDPATALLGNKLCKKVYDVEGFQIVIDPGIFIQAVIFW